MSTVRDETSRHLLSEEIYNNEVAAFLEAIQEEFQDNNKKYDEYVELCKDYKAKRIDCNGLEAKVAELFEGHDTLISGFKECVLNQYIVNTSPETEQRENAQVRAKTNFRKKFKLRFQDDAHIYRRFTVLMRSYGDKTMTTIELFDEVEKLFHDHLDLFEDFKSLFPDVSSGQNSAKATSATTDTKPNA